VALHAPAGAQQRALDLSRLTVPAERLAAGCAFAPLAHQVPDGRVQVFSSFPVRVPTNPWRGTDRPILADIRQRHTGGVMDMPDGPPPSTQEARRMFVHLADGVSEGYAAFYRAADEPNVVAVYALRFDEATDAHAWAENNGRHDAPALIAGASVVRVEAAGSRCFASVREYVASVVDAR
jgi:hypothetical protein